ncbi:MAG: hypothetical protein BroJett040_08690 [Oligoflexia bacterium]|nr:MAG: hypothetical protein BroJett040_08690 [Oligoflexia bacterium]
MKPNENRTISPLSGEKGQALVEYILIIVVTIALLLAATKFFFKPAQDWMNHYIGDYIYCLLDQGELPGLGGEETVQECEKQFEEFSFAGGKAKKGGAGAEDEESKKNKLDQAGEGSGGGSGGRGRRTRGGARYTNKGRRLEDMTAGADAAGKSEKIQEVGNKNQATKYMRITNAGAYYNDRASRTRVLGLAGLIDSEKEKIKKRENRVSVAREADQEGELKQKKMLIKPTERKIAIEEAKAEEFNLGKIFRIAIILMIVVGVGFVLFSQINAIMKSSEK